MKNSTPLAILLVFGLLPSSAAAGLPDLCDDVYLGPTGAPITDSNGVKLSRFCEWTGPAAPLWADHVCCSLTGTGASCTPTDMNGRCTTGFKMWCDYAAESAGKVTCYQPLPDACAAGLCVDAPVGTETKAADGICCVGANCWAVELDENCPGSFYLCESPFTNEDGTVGCADED